MIRIEICTSNYKSVCNAQDGGADCAELCSALEVGGITPSYGVLAEVADVMRIPVRVLIRPRSGNYIYDDREVEMMCRDIEKVAMLGYEGVVIGALNDEGDIDVKAVESMMRAGKGMKFTFHRAVDASRDILSLSVNLQSWASTRSLHQEAVLMHHVELPLLLNYKNAMETK